MEKIMVISFYRKSLSFVNNVCIFAEMLHVHIS